MNRMKPQLVSTFTVILVASLLGPIAQAAPYYYYFADDAAAGQNAPATQQQSGEAQAQAQEATAGQVQQMASDAKDAAKDAAQQVKDKVTPSGTNEAPIRERISGHMTDLYTHGRTAVKGMVDTVQPDIKNIGKDISEVYQQTRTEVGRRIEPLTQTVRPYIDQAQKAVAPYVSKAREEVPKAMSKVSSAVWSKIGGGSQQDGQTGEQAQHAFNAIQKEADKATQEATNAAQQQQQQAQQQENKQ